MAIALGILDLDNQFKNSVKKTNLAGTGKVSINGKIDSVFGLQAKLEAVVQSSYELKVFTPDRFKSINDLVEEFNLN